MDRNLASCGVIIGINKSLSARRAWIEIMMGLSKLEKPEVALRKESVDRNVLRLDIQYLPFCRSPQGERG